MMGRGSMRTTAKRWIAAARSVSDEGKWENWQPHDAKSAYGAGERHLSDRADFAKFIHPQAPQVNTDADRANKVEQDVASTCLRESCCWVIYPREQVGVNLAVMGFVWCDMLLVEFDDAGKVVRQRQVSWGVGDG